MDDAKMPEAMQQSPLGLRMRTVLHHLRTGARELSDDEFALIWTTNNPRFPLYRSRFADWSKRLGEFRVTGYEQRHSFAGAALIEDAAGRHSRFNVVLDENPPHLILGSAVFPSPPGVIARTVRMGVESKAQTQLIFTGPCSYSFENRVALSALRELLDIRLRESLREDKGGTYGVGVDASCRHIPTERYEVSVSFGSAPERVEELVHEVFAVIDSIQAGVVSDSNMIKVREIPNRAHETALRQNGAWLSAMMDADEDGRDQRDFLRIPDLVNAVTKERLRDAARMYLRRDHYARFTLLPAAKVK